MVSCLTLTVESWLEVHSCSATKFEKVARSPRFARRGGCREGSDAGDAGICRVSVAWPSYHGHRRACGALYVRFRRARIPTRARSLAIVGALLDLSRATRARKDASSGQDLTSQIPAVVRIPEAPLRTFPFVHCWRCSRAA